MKDGKILSHHNMLNVISAFVASAQLTSGWKFSYNPAETRHFSGYRAWQEYEEAMYTSNISGLKALILPVIFMDDFLKDKSSKVMSYGIYMTLANLSPKVCKEH